MIRSEPHELQESLAGTHLDFDPDGPRAATIFQPVRHAHRRGSDGFCFVRYEPRSGVMRPGEWKTYSAHRVVRGRQLCFERRAGRHVCAERESASWRLALSGIGDRRTLYTALSDPA